MKKNTYILVIVTAFLLLLLITSCNSNLTKKQEGRISPNTYINEVNVGNKTKSEAEEILKEAFKDFHSKKLKIIFPNKTYTFSFSDLNANLNFIETIDKVYSARNNNSSKISKDTNTKNYNLEVIYDDIRLNDIVNKIGNEINRTPVNASIKMDKSSNFKITKEIKGISINKESLKSEIISGLNTAKNELTEITPKIQESNPQITYGLLKGINSQISSFTTKYSTSTTGRSHNIGLATKQINGSIVLSNETFSFNEKTGKRDASKGYKTAPIVKNGQMEDGIGGGVCQVSTTLYNAITRCNIRPVSRKNHSLAPAYVKPGLDATVSESIDYKFINTLNYPIYIEGIAHSGKITFNIYSNSSLDRIKYTLVSEIYEKDKAEINYIHDFNLSKGKTIEEESSHSGYKVKVYLIGKENGKEISRVKLSQDEYKRVDGVIRIGAKE